MIFFGLQSSAELCKLSQTLSEIDVVDSTEHQHHHYSVLHLSALHIQIKLGLSKAVFGSFMT